MRPLCRLDYYCLDSPRCRLCQFKFRDGEAVVADLANENLIKFTFLRGEVFKDANANVSLHMCCQSRCYRRDRVATAFHTGCYDFKTRPVTDALLSSTDYSFTPPLWLEDQRAVSIREALAARLRRGVLRRMPLELCLAIAQHLVRECAVVTSQETLPVSKPAEISVSLARDVFVRHVDVGGVRYVSSVSNDATGALNEQKVSSSNNSLYIAYDHLGIRFVLAEKPEFPSHELELERPPAWWGEVVASNVEDPQIVLEFDGIKIKRMTGAQFLKKVPQTYLCSGASWATPTPPRLLYNFDSGDVSPVKCAGMRMSCIDCNKPCGYSVALTGYDIHSIVAHTSASNHAAYQNLEAADIQPVWMYMPVDEGEHLSEIWAYRFDGGISIGLMFLTNKDRTTIFGQYNLHPEMLLTFDCIYSTASDQSRIYINDWDPAWEAKRIGFMASDTDLDLSYRRREGDSSTFPQSVQPVQTFGEEEPNMWYYTACKLEEVTQITCCVDMTVMHRPIIGMLLRFNEGHHTCLGQWRFDWAETTLSVNTTKPMQLGFGWNKSEQYVAAVLVDGEQGSGRLSWMDVYWEGGLEWWFNRSESKVLYTRN